MLATAIQLDPDFADAMAYENLLDRIEAGLADTPEQSAEWTAKADQWVTKALDAKRRLARKPRPETQALNVDAPATFSAAVTGLAATSSPATAATGNAEGDGTACRCADGSASGRRISGEEPDQPDPSGISGGGPATRVIPARCSLPW